jgi:single-strand DNA-binding protein
MARGLNKVMLIGNLGRDPEMRYTPSGRPVTAFSLAVNRSWTTADGEHREEPEWFNVVAWGDLAERCNKFLRKGERIYIEGRLQTRSWQSADGQKHSRTEVVASELLMLDGRVREEDLAQAEMPGDEIPF